MHALLRFLEMVRRELGADDVRGEVGGREPQGDVAWAMTPNGIRIVAIFDRAPADLAHKQEKLKELAASFASLGGALDETPKSVPPRAGVGHELDEALDFLAQRARATAAVVIDDASPEIWGSSLVPHGPVDVEEAIWIAKIANTLAAQRCDLSELVAKEPDDVRATLVERGISGAELGTLAREIERARELGTRAIDRAHLTAMRGIASVREAEGKGESPSDPELHVMVRPFATIYRLLLVFEGPFSELHAEAAVIHALPTIERLVTALPPRDPATGGAKVAVLRRLRRV